MSKISKKRKIFNKKYNFKKEYSIDESINILKDTICTKFDSSIDLSINLGISLKKSENIIRNSVILPHGNGKHTKILVLCKEKDRIELKDLNIDYCGLDDYIKKIENGWFDFDIIIIKPDLVFKLVKLGKLLGPKNLMPNSKIGNITLDIRKFVQDIRLGKIFFKSNKDGILNIGIAKYSFSNNKIKENLIKLMDRILEIKSHFKGVYLKSIVISSTMGPGIYINRSFFKF